MKVPENISDIIVDRRPMPIVILDRLRREILLVLFFATFFILVSSEGPADLSPEGYKVLCVFFLCVSLWATNLIPLSITSLLAIAAIPIMGIMGASEVYAFFGNKAVFFILGVFIISAAMIACGLSARLSMWVIDNWGDNPSRLLMAIYCFAAISSCFMSEHAVAAMMFPIVMEIVSALNLKNENSVFGKGMFFALAWGCIIGGTATVFGGGRVLLGVEILEKTTHGTSIGILEYTHLSFPMVIILFVCGWVVLKLMFPPDIEDIGPAHQVLRKKLDAMGDVSIKEKGIASVMILTLIAWLWLGDKLGIANIALISIVMLFVLNLINWKMVEEHVNWGIILMYGGAICLGEVMSQSGAALWLATRTFEGTAHSAPVFLLIVAVFATVLTTFMSNSAVIAVLLPPALSMCDTYGISSSMAAMAVILPSNFAFMLPVGTPASAIAYSSRFISVGEMIRTGSILSLLGMVAFAALLYLYWPMIGYH
ncbi:MAG: DASS family sodium-coupled anion symporter [Nitrospinaceae bacterium]|jgi:sodium-dependent dicarboxylate transporter 2/3/5|nr:DASS family sodium-coupled anion symporter [Nitrospinaceae bacterium]